MECGAMPSHAHIFMKKKKKKKKKGGRLLVRYSQPGLLGRNSGLSTSKVRRSGIDRVTHRFQVDPLTAISRMAWGFHECNPLLP